MKLNDKIKIALDESRILILGAEILLGFQFRAIFEKGFEELPPASQYLKLVGLGILLVAIGLIMLPSAYHRIVWRGNDSTDVHNFTTNVMDLALIPFLIALAIDFYDMSAKLLGRGGGIFAGIMTGATAMFFWFGLGVISRRRKWDRDADRTEKRKRGHMQETELRDKVEQVLTESRVVLPGVQALMGFQLATMLIEGFDKLPASSKYVHLISLGLMGLTMILLMTPAAYHRIVEHGEDTEHFHEIASWLLLASMVPLPLGICGDLYVVIRKVTGSIPLAVVSAFVALLLFYGLWFGFTLYCKTKTRTAES
jgi:Family of unknown function (DUF6328)